MPVVAKKDQILNTTGAAEMYLDLANAADDGYLMVWASYIVWNIGGNVSRIYLEDGVNEYDLTQVYDSGININPRHFLWTLDDVPAQVDPGARVVVQFGGTADRRIICAGYNLLGVDLEEPLGTIVDENDQATTAKFADLTVPASGWTGAIFDFVSCLRGGFGTKPDYVPQTAGLIEEYDTVPFSGSEFYGAAGARKDIDGGSAVPLQWQVSPDFDTAYNYSAVAVKTDIDVPPVTQSLTVVAVDPQTLTLKES